ncbi:MAG: hypothetical protein KME53_07255 [Candidatus Thiodiazotropha sp. (ex Clathrolucina costata)]|nr:hypothetical protein [Candidatus Thiodiazotropha taylori]
MASSSQSFTIRVLPALGDQLDLPLYDTSKIEYLGGFALPAGGGTIGGQAHDGFHGSPDQGGGGIAYNPANNSLFVTGSTTNNDRVNTVLAEISIPTPSLSAPHNTAGLLQGFTLACGLNRQASVNDGQFGNGAPVSGMLVSNGRLLITVAGLYINDPTSSCMFVRPSLDLSSDNVLGPYRITEVNQRIVGNGMGCELPPAWQSLFGGYRAIVGGGGNLSLMNNACYGPGFHFFNPDDVQGSTGQTVPGVNACYYTDIAGSGYPFTPGFESDVWNGMSTHRGTIVLPETRTFMAYGCGGSDAFYDTGGAITGSWQGTYATGGTMNDRFYLYDARDLKQAFDGNQSPLNNIRPYATFDMDFCLRNTDITWISELDQVRTLGFDAVNRLAYVHERGEGIHVLRFNT